MPWTNAIRLPLCRNGCKPWLPKSLKLKNGRWRITKPTRCATCKDPNWDRPRAYKPRKGPRATFQRLCITPDCRHDLKSHPMGSPGCIEPGCSCREAPALHLSIPEQAAFLDRQFPRVRVERKEKA